MRRRLAIAALCLGLATVAAPARAQEHHAGLRTEAGTLVQTRYGGTDARAQLANMLQTQFERVAFYAEFGGAHRRGRLVRWERPIRVQLFGPDARDYTGEVVDHLAELRRLTGRSIRLLQPDEPGGNLLMWIEPKVRLARLSEGAGCRMLLDDRGFEAIQARIFIPSDDAHERRHCIVEELTQALGLTNDSKVFKRSIFNDYDRSVSLRESHDRLLVHLLYHPRLRAGMTLEEAQPVAADLIAGIVGTRP